MNGNEDSDKMVLVATTEDNENARDYKELLEANDIHAEVEKESGTFHIMVPEEDSDEAYVIIEEYEDDNFSCSQARDDEVDKGGDLEHFENDF